ncbi:hypothetical protein GGR52DRAFT_541255 [Hypoxylon sp. FL1284]|nr:hypothetical protein GGR52DRAFT_541255 [Hypoxylon sp. FL1284]
MVFIEFADCESAIYFIRHIEDQTVSPFGQFVQVSLVNTPSYPISLAIEEHLQYGCTRNVAILEKENPEEFLQAFSKTYHGHPEHILEDVWVDKRGVLFVQFRSLSEAVKFFGTIRRSSRVADQLKVDLSLLSFAADPCDPATGDQYVESRFRLQWESLLDVWLSNKKEADEEHHEEDVGNDSWETITSSQEGETSASPQQTLTNATETDHEDDQKSDWDDEQDYWEDQQDYSEDERYYEEFDHDYW